jgi:uncharacterized C2H2 Zn-finger protein
MDITEALRNEDLSKTDFFDFVSCPEMNDTTRLIRSPSSSGYIDGLQDLKETNNNHLPSADGFEHLLWGNSSANPGDKDAVKLETAIFEDWNKLWGHAVVTTAPDPAGGSPAGIRNSNTDGAIYTLTVLNGDHPAAWFTKPDEVTNVPQQPMDIESLLSIMAPPHPAANGFQSDTTELAVSPGAAATFTYTEESNADPLLNETNESYQNSLLRSALQGKTTFISRYNVKVEQDTVEEVQQHAELVVPSPVVDDPQSQDSLPSASSQALFAQTGVLPSMFEPQTMDSEPSAHSMDDLLLSQLDVTYDYEKLRRIEDEVAESVQQYCSSNSNGVDTNPPLYKLPVVSTAEATAAAPATVTATTTPAPASTKNKKYSKRSKAASEKTTTANGARKERSLHYCNICSKGFKDKYSVNVHIRTHTGEKPFACTLCGKSFRQKAHLAKHYQTHAQKASLNTSPNHKSTKR